MRCTQTMVPAMFLLTTAAFAQTTSSDSQLTQALLTEIRQLRQDLQTTAAVIQRVQILTFRLQMEAGLLTRATQRLDEARTKSSQAQMNTKAIASQLEGAEIRQRAAQNAIEQKNADDSVKSSRSLLATMTNEEQQCRAREVEAEAQSRAAQARVNEFQDQLDRLDKSLAGVAGT